MRFFPIIGLVFLFCLSVLSEANAAIKFVEIGTPFANVYEFLDPKSNILKQAKKGDHLELVYEGTSWYQVKVNEKVGWLEKRAGEVVDNPGQAFSSTFVLFLVLLAGSFGGVSFYIYRQKAAAEV